jgi:lipoprotein LprG
MTRLVAVLTIGLLALTGCSDDNKPTPDQTTQAADPVSLLTAAKKTLDETASVHVVLDSRDIPDTAQALSKGDGVVTHAPAFTGKLSFDNKGSMIDGDVVAVGGKVYVKLSFTQSFIEFSPKQLADLGAPDPSTFIDPAKGIGSWLPALKNPVLKGESRRGTVIVTEISGTVTGATLAGLFPKAQATQQFPATFGIDKDNNRLVSVMISGPFYAGATTTYDITFDRYGEQVTITKPSPS